MQSRVEEDNKHPEPGDNIRTKKMSMEGKVERIGQNAAGYEEVFFRIADGRLMKTPVDNVIVVEKLADEDIEMEGSMGGINRSAPAQDVSYEHVLDDVYESWNSEKKRVLSSDAQKYFGESKKPLVKAPPKKKEITKKITRPAPRLETKSVIESVVGLDLTGMIDMAASGNESLMPVRIKQVTTENRNLSYQQRLDRMMAPKNKNQEDDQDIAYKLGVRETDVQTLRDLLDGKISFVDLPLEFRHKMYNFYSGVPYQNNGKLTPGFASKLSRALGISGRDNRTQDMFGYGDVDEAITPWGGYTKDDKKANALAKAPKSTMQGTKQFTFSQMVQDSIRKHGVKWAFQYYVVKHGLPPRHFRIYAGI